MLYGALTHTTHTFTHKIHAKYEHQYMHRVSIVCDEVFGFTVIHFASVILVSKQIDDGTFVCCSTIFYLDSISKASQQYSYFEIVRLVCTFFFPFYRANWKLF